jgi:antitoxin component YwqK of YwqJK toxin-antitoxin module
MKKLLALIMSFVPLISNAQKIETVYYDKDGIGVSGPTFASYYRVYTPVLIGNKKRYRDYYMSGKLMSEGEYESIDKRDDAYSIFKGECVSYYESGKIKEKKIISNGLLNGEYTTYYESGLVELHTFMKDGKKNGLDTYFDEKTGKCYQKYMQNGEPLYDYCIVSNEEGYCCKVRISDNTVLWDNPQISDRQTIWRDDSQWSYYQKNGVLIALKNTLVKDYGKWFRINVQISNHTLVPFNFGAQNFSATVRKKNGKEMSMGALSAGEFMRTVESQQTAALIGAGIAEGLAAANAGFSRSTTYTNSSYNGYANSSGSAYAYGSGGYAQSSYSSTGNFYGNSSTTSTTVSYNAFAAYQAQVLASNRIASLENAMWHERAQRQEGYLKKTTIYPGETVTGYVNIPRVKGESIKLIVDLYAAKYQFDWNL